MVRHSFPAFLSLGQPFQRFEVPGVPGSVSVGVGVPVLSCVLLDCESVTEQGRPSCRSGTANTSLTELH